MFLPVNWWMHITLHTRRSAGAVCIQPRSATPINAHDTTSRQTGVPELIVYVSKPFPPQAGSLTTTAPFANCSSPPQVKRLCRMLEEFKSNMYIPQKVGQSDPISGIIDVEDIV